MHGLFSYKITMIMNKSILPLFNHVIGACYIHALKALNYVMNKLN